MPLADTLGRFFTAIGLRRPQGDDDKATGQGPTLPGSNTDKVNEYTGAADRNAGEPPKF